jgi:hypothetical protein
MHNFKERHDGQRIRIKKGMYKEVKQRNMPETDDGGCDAGCGGIATMRRLRPSGSGMLESIF